MTTNARSSNTGYPGIPMIRKVIEAARSVGIRVAALEVGRDGTIKVSEGAMLGLEAENEFDRLDSAGLL